MLTTIVLLLVCALIAIAAVPLMLRLIPRNPIYGLPTERALANDETWFRVNAFAGRAVLVAMAIAALLIMVYNGTLLRSGWMQLLVLVLAAAIAVGVSLVYDQRLANPRWPKG
ncbi:MAG TPA: SdpI family protein [Usitatibacter sp.]|nr:SdpI family protein [Usitatibacter sp.]